MKDEKSLPGKIFVNLELDTATGGLQIQTNAASQIMALGMVAMATSLMTRQKPPEEPKIKVASAIPGGIPVPGHS